MTTWRFTTNGRTPWLAQFRGRELSQRAGAFCRAGGAARPSGFSRAPKSRTRRSRTRPSELSLYRRSSAVWGEPGISARSALRPYRQPWDERLGHRGRVAMGAEEWHLLKLLLPAGEVWYEAEQLSTTMWPLRAWITRAIRRRMWQLGFGNARSERLLGEPQPAWPRVAVRTVRIGREAARQRALYAAAGGQTTPDAAWADFYSHFWWGRHVEMLTGRFRWLADRLAARALG